MVDKLNNIIYIEREEVLSQRMQLMADAEKFLRKIVRMNCIYTGKIRKIEKKLAQLEKLLGE